MKIIKSEFVLSGTKIEHLPPDTDPEFLFCGRSNVGKSSFINALMNRKNLAHTSSNPGKTQTLNYYRINDILYFVDVPGYGYAKVSKKIREEFGQMIELYLTERKNLRLAFLLIDFRHGPTQDDLLMKTFLEYHEIPLCIICTKKDKVKKSEFFKQKKMILNQLQRSEDELFVITSSETGDGLPETLEIIEKYASYGS